MLDTLRPQVQVLHDVVHFNDRSHHGLCDPFLQAEHRRTGNDSVEAEIAGDAAFLRSATRADVLTVLPDANHHGHLRRWLAEADFRADAVNARYESRPSPRAAAASPCSTWPVPWRCGPPTQATWFALRYRQQVGMCSRPGC